MIKEPPQEMFLPVHGYVALYAEEIAIIDHPSFQRLRTCRQLGFAHLVFPGAVHTRFEHSIGAVHVVNRIIKHINLNSDKYEMRHSSSSDDYACKPLSDPVKQFARLSALLHDIGHVPYGHSLEDELEHLEKHDASERLNIVANSRFENFKWPSSIREAYLNNKDWGNIKYNSSLRQLVDLLYRDTMKEIIDVPHITPMRLVELFSLKSPTKENASEESIADWERDRNEVESLLPLQVCRDIVGNTICADLLDYAYRDWYHLGRPLYEDLRLYQYMEVRVHKDESADYSKWAFIINVGPEGNRRLDALSDILQLLDTRYKLCETVLFHRTKLAVTALVDRCFIEIRRLYDDLELGTTGPEISLNWEEYLKKEAVELLLANSDDGLGDVLTTLASGGRNSKNQEKISRALSVGRSEVPKGGRKRKKPEENEPTLIPDEMSGHDVDLNPVNNVSASAVARIDLIKTLIARIRHRQVYREVLNKRADEFPSMNVEHIVKWYKLPEGREKLLRMVEEKCLLPEGSLLLYCPPDTKMNAKVAKVKALIDGEISELDSYERTSRSKEQSLTSGAVRAQLDRFHHLWKLRFYVQPDAWEMLSEKQRGTLVHILGEIATPTKAQDCGRLRKSLEPHFEEFKSEIRKAARGGSNPPTAPSMLGNWTELSNGIPIECPE